MVKDFWFYQVWYYYLKANYYYSVLFILGLVVSLGFGLGLLCLI